MIIILNDDGSKLIIYNEKFCVSIQIFVPRVPIDNRLALAKQWLGSKQVVCDYLTWWQPHWFMYICVWLPCVKSMHLIILKLKFSKFAEASVIDITLTITFSTKKCCWRHFLQNFNHLVLRQWVQLWAVMLPFLWSGERSIFFFI